MSLPGQGARVSQQLLDVWFKPHVHKGEYFISRYNMERVVELFSSDLAAMRRVEKKLQGEKQDG